MIWIFSVVCVSLVVVLIQLLMTYQKRAHDLRMKQEPVRRLIRLHKQAMLESIERLHAAADGRLEELIEETEKYKLETAQSAGVLKRWQERVGVEEGEEEAKEAEELQMEEDSEKIEENN
jgi:hypothetical protein